MTNDGPFHIQFEKKLKQFLGLKHITLVNNATSGLLISIFSGFILISLGIIGEYFWRILENIKKPEWYTINKFIK